MKHRSKAQWLTLLAEHKTSGLSAAQFCRVRKLNANTLSLLKQQLQGQGKEVAAFMPVVVSRAALPTPIHCSSPEAAAGGTLSVMVGSCALQFDTLPAAHWLVSVVRGLA
jgi:hypothetical protein